MTRTLATLQPWLDAGVPIVGLEPSCTAALKSEATELLPDHPGAKQASAAVRSLAEILRPHADALRARAAEQQTTAQQATGHRPAQRPPASSPAPTARHRAASRGRPSRGRPTRPPPSGRWSRCTATSTPTWASTPTVR